jgi:RNA-directed DNA polymerase
MFWEETSGQVRSAGQAVYDTEAAGVGSVHEGQCWRIHKRIGSDLAELAEWINPIVHGWMNYYGRFNRSRLYRLLQRINTYIVRWARNKYRRLGSFKKAKRWWTGLVDREPGLFAHWAWISAF